MKNYKKVFLILFFVPILHTVYADDCQSNGLGGSFCIKDDGTTSNSIPNEANGQDTLSSNGKWSSTTQDGTGTEYTVSNNGVTEKPSHDKYFSDSPKPKPSESDKILLENNWNSPSNVTSDGAATSSITPDDSSSDKWP